MLRPMYAGAETTIARPVSTAILAIDSEDRFQNYDFARNRTSTPYSFAIHKNESMMSGFFTRIAVTEVVFPVVIPNINLFTQKITFFYQTLPGAAVDVQLTLPVGFYTPAAIAAALQAQIRALDATLANFTMTYGVNTEGTSPTQSPIFEYQTNLAGTRVAFTPLDPVFNLGTDPTRKQLFDILGFTLRNTEFPNSDIVAKRGLPTYCQYTRYIDIVCSQLTGLQSLKDTMTQTIARDVLCRIYLGDGTSGQSTVLPSSGTFCPPGCMPFTIYRNFSSPKQIQWIADSPVPGFLQFDVFDDNGQPLGDCLGTTQNGNGINWSMTCLVTEN